MAKGEQRSNREAKKPKASKKTVVAPSGSYLQTPNDKTPPATKKK